MGGLIDKPSVLFVNAVRGELYLSLAVRIFGDAGLGFQFAPTTPAAFIDITKNSTGWWSLVLIDATLAESGAFDTAMNDFLVQNPNVVVCVESPLDAPPPKLKFPVSLVRLAPNGPSEWKALMTELLALVRSRRGLP